MSQIVEVQWANKGIAHLKEHVAAGKTTDFKVDGEGILLVQGSFGSFEGP